MTETELLERNRKLLVQHFNAKDSKVVKNSEYMVTYTEHHQWILSPKSSVTKHRKVITQL